MRKLSVKLATYLLKAALLQRHSRSFVKISLLCLLCYHSVWHMKQEMGKRIVPGGTRGERHTRPPSGAGFRLGARNGTTRHHRKVQGLHGAAVAFYRRTLGDAWAGCLVLWIHMQAPPSPHARVSFGPRHRPTQVILPPVTSARGVCWSCNPSQNPTPPPEWGGGSKVP